LHLYVSQIRPSWNSTPALKAQQAVDETIAPALDPGRGRIKLVNLWPASRLDELMPWAWAAAHSDNKLAA
jgi:hypothetical protein